MFCLQLIFLAAQLGINAASFIFDWAKIKLVLKKMGWFLFPVLSILLTYLYFYFFDIPENQRAYVSGKMRCGNGELGYIIFQYFWLFMVSFILQVVCDIIRYFTSKKTIVEKH
jgi:hypothetical protein